MQKEHGASMKKEYKKPKVTVTKLQIEERLMQCGKTAGNVGCTQGHGGQGIHNS